MPLDTALLHKAIWCRCPRCGEGPLYPALFDFKLASRCAVCDLDLTHNDSADGPAVFLIFVLGFLLVPLALGFEYLVHPPLWVHAVLWTAVALALTLGTLKPLKAFVIALQFKYRPGDWK